MKKLTSEEIVFEPSCINGGKHWSDIMFQGEVIGAMLERERNLFAPIETRYQLGVDKNLVDVTGLNYYEGESVGWVYVIFTKLEEFINFYNEKVSGITNEIYRRKSNT